MQAPMIKNFRKVVFLTPCTWKTVTFLAKKNLMILFLCLKYIPARNSGGVGGIETDHIVGK